MTDAQREAARLVSHLRTLRSPRDIEGQRRFGIKPAGEHLGIAIPVLRALARGRRGDHALALALWDSGVQEARILAAYVDDPTQVTRTQMERWTRDFDNWALCDQVCGNLFVRTPQAAGMAEAWSRRRAEYTKRAGFALMAALAVHRKELPDRCFRRFLARVRGESGDSRNFVRKAANWALRQIGKRSPGLRRSAVAEARRIAALGTPSGRWIASDALRELGR